MSGHNKWSQIKHAKEITDGKRSKVFGKMAKLIALESKKALGNLSSPTLRAVIERARKENMPVDNIDRAVKKGAGGDAGEMEAVLYEAYGPGGCAMLIEELTDNKNRSVAEIKHTLSKHNLTLAGQGAALWAFMKNEEGFVPQVMITLSEADNESLTLLLKELDENDDVQDVWTNAEH